MVKLSYLDPFTVYRTKPPIIMPEGEKNRRKGKSFMILAPSVDDELDWLSDSSNPLKFRYLSKYYVEKKYAITLKGVGRKVLWTDKDGEITSLFNRYHRGNLSHIDGVTSFLPNVKSTLRDFNVLVEINHITDIFMSNDKDKRLPYIKVDALMSELGRVMDVSALGAYENLTIIPMSLWFSHADYANPATLMRQKSKSFMGVFMSRLMDPAVLKKFGKVLIVDGNYILLLDPATISEKSGKLTDAEFLRDRIFKFMRKAKGGKITSLTGEPDDEGVADISDEEEDAAEESEAPGNLKAAEKKTEVDVATDKVLASLKVDPDAVSEPTKEKVKTQVRKTIEKTPKPAESEPDPDIDEFPEEAEERESDSDDVIKNMTLDQETHDAVLSAQIEGRSAASQKRNEQLREKFKELSLGNRKLTDLIEEKKELEIPTTPVLARTVNPALRNIRAAKFEDKYDEALAQQDLVSILLHFSGVRPAMFLNKDIEITDVSTHTDRVLRYHVQFEDENRKRHTFFFKLPKMYKHKYLYLNGQELTITHQKLPFPITKVKDDRCQLVTCYNKVFVYRYGAALSPRMVRLKKLFAAQSNPKIVVRKGDCTALNRDHLTTIEFDELASAFERIQIGKAGDALTLFFDPSVANVNIPSNLKPGQDKLDKENAGLKASEKSLSPIGIKKSPNKIDYYWISSDNNQIYDRTGKANGELSDFITESLIGMVPGMDKELEGTSAGTKFMYSRIRIMAQNLPLIVVMGAADPDGLVGALEKGKVKYHFYDKKPKDIDKTVSGVIPFADGYLVYDRYPMENALLMNGLQIIPTKEFNFYDMGTRDAYVEIFDLLCGQRSLADNLGAFYYMMIDPITKDVLKRLNMPTDFITLLHWCNGVLVDNQFQIDSNYENCRIRSNEIIMNHLYRELAVAWANYRSGRTDTFSIPEDIVIKLLLTSKIVDPKSKLNISLELENDRNVKLKGPSGMNEDHSFTIEKRAFHPSMRGIVATNSVPSGEVGINRHMVVNPNLNDARGFITVNKSKSGDYDGTELLSPAEMLSPFSAESADIERLCMSISQAKHVVPTAKESSCPVSFDFERVAPYLSNDFAATAKKDGQVVEISEDLMIIKYDDGTTDDIDLSEHPAKNTDGGFFIMNKMDTKLKVGSRVKAGQILAYDKKVVADTDFFGDPCASVGVLARVCFESNGNVYEDAGYITDTFAHEFATKVTKQKRVILSKYANVKKIATIGQHVQANDIILAFDDTEDEFSSQLLASITEQMGDEDEVSGTSAPVITKFTGVVKDIQIMYTIPTDEMSPSLKKIVEDYAKSAGRREKVLRKYMNPLDANTFVKSSEMQKPDSRGKVAGTKIDEGVIIDFFIEYEDVAGNGDKGSITALKFTTCNVIPAELAGYAESNPNRKISLHVASFGAFKRMVADVEKMGVLNKVLIETKRMMKEKYHDRIKAEIKRLKGSK